jgi:hypothetical protein
MAQTVAEQLRVFPIVSKASPSFCRPFTLGTINLLKCDEVPVALSTISTDKAIVPAFSVI